MLYSFLPSYRRDDPSALFYHHTTTTSSDSPSQKKVLLLASSVALDLSPALSSVLTKVLLLAPEGATTSVDDSDLTISSTTSDLENIVLYSSIH